MWCTLHVSLCACAETNGPQLSRSFHDSHTGCLWLFICCHLRLLRYISLLRPSICRELTSPRRSILRTSIVILATTAIMLSGCATPPPIEKHTSSGKPEVTLTQSNVADARGRLLAACARRGMTVEEGGANTVTCGRTLSGSGAAVAQLLVGNSHSTTPVQKSTFLLTQQGTNVFIMHTNSWIETQMALGQVRRQEVMSNNLINSVQKFLDDLATIP